MSLPRSWMIRWCGVAAAACLCLPGASRASAANPAWQTWAYPGYFPDLVATPTDLWGATREGGLVRLDRANGALEVIFREPGGLVSNELTGLALDRSGRLWAGTSADGVSRRRADGSGWDLVNTFDGLPSNRVTALHAAGDTVWIGTVSGLALWNGSVISGSLPDGNTVSFDTTFSNLEITAILQAGDSLWVGTRRGIGLAHLSSGLADWREMNEGIEAARLDIEDLVTDGTDVFVVGVGYCYRWRPELASWEFVSGVANNVFGGPGVMLLGTTTGIGRWNGFDFDPVPGAPAPVAKVSDIYTDQVRAVQAADGTVFAATGTFVHERSPAGAWTVRELSAPPDNSLIDIGLDRTRLYVTSFGGVGRFDGTRWRYWKAGEGCAACDTTFENPGFPLGLLTDSQHRKWVGSWTTAFERFVDDGPVPAFTRLWDVTPNGDVNQPNAGQTWTYASVEDASGGCWFGLDTADRDNIDPLGLAYYDPSGNYVRVYDTADGLSGLFVRGLAVGKNGRLWLGYEGEGVDYVEAPELAKPVPTLNSGTVKHLVETGTYLVRAIHAAGDSIWIVTPSALYRYGFAVGTTATAQQTITYSGGQDQFALQPLATTANGTVWLATAAGLREYRRDGTANLYTTANSPLASNVVRSLVVDPATDDLWIATNLGLHRFDPQYVPAPPPPIDRLAVKVWPNPARVTGAGVSLRMSGDGASYRGSIYDIGGRELRSFTLGANGGVFWDGRDADGRVAPPGVYLARIAAGGREAIARFVLVR